MLRKRFNAWCWQRRYKTVGALSEEDPNWSQRLRLVLGVGRSGTSWLSRVLSHTSTPIRFFNEFLFRYRPKLIFSDRHDHTAIKYKPTLPEKHPLVYAYRTLTVPKSRSWSKLGVNKHPLRDDSNWEVCLVKEVHALLGTEALVKRLECPSLFIARDPIYVVDSLLSFRGLEAPIWRNEYAYITAPQFLDRFFPSHADVICRHCTVISNSDTVRRKIILSKTLTVGLINKMLRILAQELGFVRHIRYEELCRAPVQVFSEAANFLRLEVGPEMLDFLEETQSSTPMSQNNPYSVFRDITAQLERPLRFVLDSEAKEMEALLENCDLL